MMNLSPHFVGTVDRKAHILAATGGRVGGNDLDISLAFYKICRELGKESLDKQGSIVNRSSPVGLDIYWNATHINNVHAIAEFRNEVTGGRIERCAHSTSGNLRRQILRLSVLHGSDYAFRLNRGAELSKILLSSKENIRLPLNYLEPGFHIQLDRDDLDDAIHTSGYQIREIISGCIKMAGERPEIVYVTGGSAKSPTLMNMVMDSDLRSRIVSGDTFGSVAQGLVIAAENRFR